MPTHKRENTSLPQINIKPIDKSKKRTRRKFTWLFIITLLVVAVLALGREGVQKVEIKAEFLRPGIVSQDVICEAVSIRPATAIKAPSNGLFLPFKESGAHVHKDEIIGYIIPVEAASVVQELTNANYSVAVAFNNAKTNGEIDLKTMSYLPKSQIWQNQFDKLNSHDLLSAAEATSKIDASLLSLSKTLSEWEKTSSDELNQAIQVQQASYNKLIATATAIKTDIAGMVGYGINQDNVALSEILKPDLIERILQASLQTNHAKPMVTGEPVAQIYDGFTQRLAMIVPEVEPSAFSAYAQGNLTHNTDGKNLELRHVNGNLKITDAVITQAEKTQSGTLLVVETSQALGLMATTPLQKLSIVLNAEKGLRVPIASLYQEEGSETRIRIVVGGFVQSKEVSVVLRGGDEAIVRTAKPQPQPSFEGTEAQTTLFANLELEQENPTTTDVYYDMEQDELMAALVVTNPSEVKDGAYYGR